MNSRRCDLRLGLALCTLLSSAGCSPATSGDSETAAAVPGDESASRTGELATADPFARGYTHDDFPRVTRIAPDVYTWEQLRSAGDEWFTTVSLFVVGDEGVLVADGQGTLTETTRLVAYIDSVHALPVTDLVIGSDHGDHTAGNAAFPEGLRIYAHPRSDAALRQAGHAPATHLISDRETLDFGPQRVDIAFLGPAHTGGDLVVHLPDAGVLFMSEAFLHRVFPAMRSACPSEWVRMVERAQALQPVIPVPGHGFVDAPPVLVDELEEFRQALVTVVAEGRRLHEAGLDIDAALEQADFGELTNWSLAAGQAPIALRQIYAELEGRLQCEAFGQN